MCSDGVACGNTAGERQKIYSSIHHIGALISINESWKNYGNSNTELELLSRTTVEKNACAFPGIEFGRLMKPQSLHINYTKMKASR